MTRPDSDNPLN